MIALMKDFNTSQKLGQRRFPVDLCGPYLYDETDDARVRCFLQIAQTEVTIDLPADLLNERRRGSFSGVVLRLPGERVATAAAALTPAENEQQTAKGWIVEMEGFDRF